MNSQYSGKTGNAGMDTEQKILYSSSFLKVPESKSGEDALILLKSRISDMGKAPVILKPAKTRLLYWISSIAAGLLLLFGIWQTWFHSPETRIVAGQGLHREQVLPDGSRVILNADSKITYNSKKFDGDRHVWLDGEAFFDITKGSTFSISTSYGDISVLGTSFNIYSRDNSFKVSCFTGTVLVAAESQSVLINPGESASLSGTNLVSFQEANLSSISRWIDGEFFFVDSPLNLVFDEIERQFNVNFAGHKFPEKHFTGSFTNKDLGIALEIVCIPMELNYEIDSHGKISVSEKTK